MAWGLFVCFKENKSYLIRAPKKGRFIVLKKSLFEIWNEKFCIVIILVTYMKGGNQVINIDFDNISDELVYKAFGVEL